MVAHEILVSAQGPLVLGFWVGGFGVWGLGLTIYGLVRIACQSPLISPRGPSTSLRLATHCATLLESVVRGSLSSSESSSSDDILRFSVRSTACNKDQSEAGMGVR